ncbi:MAG: XRE family transcriptional regulator [Clostridia bacterium]|nr:XRE family transcriptional regulator [Clostridia bacterium]
MKVLALRLRELRKERGLRQEDAARELCLSTNGYQRYELDERDPTAPVIVAIADFYGVSADYLLGRSDHR